MGRVRQVLRDRDFAGAGGLASGGLLSGVAVLVSLPIVTRLYSPDQYSGYALVLAASALLATVISGRYEMACVVARHDDTGDREAWKAARLAVLVSAVGSCILQIGLLATFGLEAVGVPISVGVEWLLLPLVVLFSAVQSIQSLLDTRLGHFYLISITTAGRGVILCGLQIVVGFVWASTLILLLSLVASLLPSAARLCYLLVFRKPGAYTGSYMDVARMHRRFPQFQIWAGLANSLSFSLFVFVLAFAYDDVVVGLFAVASRIVLFPTTVVTGPVNTVYLRQAARQVDDQVAAFRVYRRRTFQLTAFGLFIFALMAALTPLAEGIFGAQWEDAASYIYCAIPMGLALFVGSLTNSTLIVHRRQPQLLAWRIGLVGVGPVLLLAGPTIGASAPTAVAIASMGLLLGTTIYAVWAGSVFDRPLPLV